ncbi:MAG: response regulator [Gammaproteobacteria bacterium]|nr:response regulator [Gammaproteobacteria bacterium]
MITNFCCCFYPTTVVCVDDDVHLLKWMTLLLEEQFKVLAFHDPLISLAFIEAAGILSSKNQMNQAKLDPNVLYFDLNIQKIHTLIYDAKRSAEISTLVIDYYMPGLNGLELCKHFKNEACKKILLTGEVDQQMAVVAFNDGVIDQFVMKGQAQVMEELQVQIKRMQWQYFFEKTRSLTDSLLQAYPQVFSYLEDLEFCEAFYTFLRQHKIKEGYLFNGESDYLLIDQSNQLWWLSIKNQYAIQTLIHDAENEFLQEPSPEAEAIFKVVKSGKKLPLTVLSKKVLDISEWERILVHPIAIMTTKETYQVLLSPDVGQAHLRYDAIKFI